MRRVDFGSAKCHDTRLKVDQYPMNLDGFQDVSALLRCGFYALCRGGVVIYVVKAKSFPARSYAHRNRPRGGKWRKTPSWFPQAVRGIFLREVFSRHCRLEEL